MLRCFLLFAWIVAPVVSACCMVPRTWDGRVQQNQQKALVLHNDGTEHLILKIAPEFSGKGAPQKMAWVVTVPNLPKNYAVADESIIDDATGMHEKLVRLAMDQWQERSHLYVPSFSQMMGTSVDGSANAVSEHPTINVGPYSITPVQATGQHAVDQLNKYLADEGYPPEEPSHLEYFIENDFTFLCIRVTTGNSAKLAKNPNMPPLRITFDTDAPYYPAKFSSRQGNFGLDLTIITTDPLDSDVLQQLILRTGAHPVHRVVLGNLWSTQPLPESIAEHLPGVDPDRWYVNRLTTDGFNDEGQIAKWKDDLFFTLGSSEDSVPGFWYYGDTEIGFMERMFREHIIAIFFWFMGLSFIGLMLKSRANKRRAKAEKS